MKMLKNIWIAGAVMIGFAACKPNVQTPAPYRGSADFTRYIAVGNSLTAGYADNGLYLEGQKNSYPSIIARQMLQTNGGMFSQPLFTDAQANGSGYIRLKSFNADGTPVFDTVKTQLAIRGAVTIPGYGNVTTYTKYTGDNNNYGIPGIKLAQIQLAAYGNLNGYYERLLPGNAGTNTTAYLDFVTANPYTFFSSWLGNNDALSYATGGGESDTLTSKAYFTNRYTVLLNRLTAGGQKGVCATIPDVTSIPYFNTITTAKLLAAAQKANPAVTAIYISAKKTTDPTDTTHAVRMAASTDLFILTFPVSKLGTSKTTSAGTFPYGLSPYTPIDKQYVLDANEALITQDFVVSYNASIKNLAAAKGIAVADMYSFFYNVKQNGLQTDGLNLTTDYISGGLFSLDGIHLTPRGYAVVANQFIKAINAQYGSNIPIAEVATYRAVKFP